jgi:HK97 gp10 family phage protein
MANKNGRVIQQLNALQNLGDIMPLPAAQYVAKQARDYAHVITGYMRDHTVARQTGKTAVVVSEAPYAAFEEFGTRFRPAHPFIRVAIADAAIYLPGMTAREVNQEIRRRVSRA